MDLIAFVGISASILTATSLIPQIYKLVKERKSADVSVLMLSVLLGGLSLWVAYGILKHDWIIIISNSFALVVNLTTVALTLYFK